MKVGIMGLGGIAGVMGNTLKQMKDAECFAAASRNLEKAEKFAKEYGCKKAYGSYEELVQDEEVELIYIATPHSHHYENMKLCLAHNKAILCEKAFTINARQAKEILTIAKEKNIFVAEAIWTRYLPVRDKIDEIIQSGIIGKPHMLTANLGFPLTNVERIWNPKLAGGALLDVGVYTLNFAAMTFGTKVKTFTSSAAMSDLGVDGQNSLTLTYEDGKMAVLNSTTRAMSDNRCVIYGEKGLIEAENIINIQQVKVFNLQRELIETYTIPEQITGYEYEVEACMNAMKEKQIECANMPHVEIIRLMEWMDEFRIQWEMKYPME